TEEIGYVDGDQVFRADAIELYSFLSKQAGEISQGVTAATSLSGEQGAGDQGIMFGYATDETPELMPLPILLAHRLANRLADHRKKGGVRWLRPDAKTQVSVLYQEVTEGKRSYHVPIAVTDVLVSTQHVARRRSPRRSSSPECRECESSKVATLALSHFALQSFHSPSERTRSCRYSPRSRPAVFCPGVP
ncbi:MAG: hypothetical protein KY464_16310, partial [Gemmatimonadetes bacterium]|nr:hypothetical protein [Gemmatimonadota bacterium]